MMGLWGDGGDMGAVSLVGGVISVAVLSELVVVAGFDWFFEDFLAICTRLFLCP